MKILLWILIGRAIPEVSVPSYVAYIINKRFNSRESITIIDLGCGDGARFSVVKKLLNIKYFAIGIDIHLPYLKKAKKVYDEVVLCDVLHLPIKISRAKIALALDLVEHLYKRDAVQLITSLDPVSFLILTTPNDFQPRGMVSGNPYEAHKCGFQVAELKKLGFEVYGLWGLREINPFFKAGNLSFPPNVIIILARVISQIIIRVSKKAELSSSLMAIKQNRRSG